MDDARLIAAARNGDEDAARQLVRRHWPALWRVVYGLSGRPALAEEIAQETFARAFAALDRFDDQRPLGPWLRKIALNSAIDELRRERRLSLVEPPDHAYEDELPDDSTLASVRRLDPDRRAVIVLRFWLDWSLEQIAETLDLPLGTVSSRLTRGLEELRKEDADACTA